MQLAYIHTGYASCIYILYAACMILQTGTTAVANGAMSCSRTKPLRSSTSTAASETLPTPSPFAPTSNESSTAVTDDCDTQVVTDECPATSTRTEFPRFSPLRVIVAPVFGTCTRACVRAVRACGGCGACERVRASEHACVACVRACECTFIGATPVSNGASKLSDSPSNADAPSATVAAADEEGVAASEASSTQRIDESDTHRVRAQSAPPIDAVADASEGPKLAPSSVTCRGTNKKTKKSLRMRHGSLGMRGCRWPYVCAARERKVPSRETRDNGKVVHEQADARPRRIVPAANNGPTKP